MYLEIILLLLGFLLLIKGADFLVTGSVSLARNMNVSGLVIGLTVVAFSTSTPELVVTVVSSLNGHPDVSVGNIIGSNIINLMLILGSTAVIYPLAIQRSTILKEIPFSIVAAMVLFILANDQLFNADNKNQIGFVDGLILIFFLGVFFVFIIRNVSSEEIDNSYDESKMDIKKSVLYISGGMIALILGGRFAVNSAVEIARIVGLSERVIALTIVALGTSLPELVTSIMAAIRKSSDIAVGNIIGSNIFNIFMVLPICAFISPIPYSMSFNLDFVLLLVSSVLLMVFTYSGRKAVVDRWEGVIFVVSYIIYVVYIVSR